MQSSTAIPTTFYRLPKVREICGGVSASTIWSWVKHSDKTGFPRPYKISKGCTAWNSAEIEAWAQSRIASSNAQLDACEKASVAAPAVQQAGKQA